MKITHYQTYPVEPEAFEKYCRFVDIVYACKFYSSGKNGKFDLRLLITKFKDRPDTTSFYLAFGVWNEISQDVDDQIETRNDDMQLILATVGNKALEFLRQHSHAELYAEGSTPVRTRLYQREISKIIDQLPAELKREGLIRNGDLGFIAFQKGINFDAFLLSSK